MPQPYRSWIACACLVAAPLVLLAQPPSPPACIDGTSQTFSATGALQTYSVPPGTTALLITAEGATMIVAAPVAAARSATART